MRKNGIALILVLLTAGVASAQMIVPEVYYTSETIEGAGGIWSTGDSFPFQGLGLGVAAQVGGVLTIDGQYASFNEEVSPGYVVKLDRLRFQAAYALYQGGGFAAGPALAYRNAKFDDGEWTDVMNGLGIGGFVAFDLGGAAARAVYTAYPTVSYSEFVFGAPHGEYSGAGSGLTVRARIPVSGMMSLVAGYSADTYFTNDHWSLSGSAFDVGAAFAF